MNEQFVTYKVFNDPELAKAFADILEQNKILFKVDEDTYNFDPSYAFNPLNKDYRIKIRQGDFHRANEAFAQHFQATVDSVEKDYYLYAFTDQELFEILQKPDEWGELDYQLAQKILTDRGRSVNPEQLDGFKNARLEQLRKPEKTEYTSIVVGYVLAVVLGFVGMFLGYMLAYSKKTLPNGQTTYAYSETQRQHGRIILVISSVISAYVLLATLTKSFSLSYG
jgi:hypothetical protein